MYYDFTQRKWIYDTPPQPEVKVTTPKPTQTVSVAQPKPQPTVKVTTTPNSTPGNLQGSTVNPQKTASPVKPVQTPQASPLQTTVPGADLTNAQKRDVHIIVAKQNIDASSKRSADEIVNRQKSFLTKVQDFITPDSSNVLGNTILNLPGAAAKTIGDIGQGIARNIGSAGVSLGKAISGDNAESYTPGNEVTKTVFGEEPIDSIEKRIADTEIKIKDVGTKIASGELKLIPDNPDSNVKPLVDNKSIGDFLQKHGLLLAGALVSTDVGMDLYPPTAGKDRLAKDTLEQLAKTTDVNLVKTILKDAKVASTMIDDIAPAIAKATDVKGINEILKSKPLKFLENSIKEAPNISSEVKQGVTGSNVPLANKETLAEAKKIISETPEEAYRIAKSKDTSAVSSMVREQMIVELDKVGRIEDAIDLAQHTAEIAKTQGQAIQALSVFGKLSPEGILRYTQKQLEIANQLRDSKSLLKLEPEAATDIMKQARELGKMEDGRAKDIATAKLLDTIASQIPSSVLSKISSLQIMAQLLNPKTAIRNIVGNAGFQVLETGKDVVATILDTMVGVVTGERTKSLPSITAQAKGFAKGGYLGLEDAMLGIDTLNLPSQFDLPKSIIWRSPNPKINALMTPLRGAEKLLNVELKAPDRAFYTAAFEDSLRSQMKLAKVTEPTADMMQIAHLDGLYRTFQDDSALARVFIGIKKALNAYQDFGMGDVVLRYPKTPANLLNRGLAYSPAGFMNTVYHLARPIIGKQFDQKAFVESLSRAGVGTTSAVGTGVLLHKLGIITGKKNEDKDISALERETGLGQYKINLSALKRFALSWNPEEAKTREGDKLMSYDWFQPIAIGISMGANIDENLGKSNTDKIKGIIPTLIASIGEGVDTLGEQPLIQGLTNPFRYNNSLGDSLMSALKSVPASFVPALLNQVKQLMDNQPRETRDPNFFTEMKQQVMSRIPGLSDNLPGKQTVFGEPQEQYQNDSNNIFNVFFNPSYLSKVEMSPEAKMVLDIYKNSGETQQAPRVVPFSQTISKNGESENIKLTGKQQVEMQKFVGDMTKDIFSKMANNQEFMTGDDEEKAKYLSGLLSDVNTVAKIKILGHRPLKPAKRVIKLYELYTK